jgi:hypothetical protein
MQPVRWVAVRWQHTGSSCPQRSPVGQSTASAVSGAYGCTAHIPTRLASLRLLPSAGGLFHAVPEKCINTRKNKMAALLVAASLGILTGQALATGSGSGGGSSGGSSAGGTSAGGSSAGGSAGPGNSPGQGTNAGLPPVAPVAAVTAPVVAPAVVPVVAPTPVAVLAPPPPAMTRKPKPDRN